MRKHGFIDFNVDTSTSFSCITPIDSFNHVEFREELLTSTPKHSSHPELLRQLALEATKLQQGERWCHPTNLTPLIVSKSEAALG
ncbi:hypothetical protein TNIN_122361 [Trichonephila inaurata madagascariensis]|uniref:Uncharacterized protein n=1 Tax=Trichonephila inaurata madagascariensis TaxID=2747483 RepID=A0A8X7CCG8_9ARAC|nr:hypothetical protein TNIN_122361 [Trichonephila inaurata madagascariensis]